MYGTLYYISMSCYRISYIFQLDLFHNVGVIVVGFFILFEFRVSTLGNKNPSKIIRNCMGDFFSIVKQKHISIQIFKTKWLSICYPCIHVFIIFCSLFFKTPMVISNHFRKYIRNIEWQISFKHFRHFLKSLMLIERIDENFMNRYMFVNWQWIEKWIIITSS